MAQEKKEDTNTKPTLGYWNIRGLAAPIRYLLSYCGVTFEDKMYSVTDGPEFDRKEWLSVKETLGFEYPNLPYLIDGETKITESRAIMKYIARKWRPALVGTTSAEMARIEMLDQHVSTLKSNVTKACYNDGDREAIIKDSRPLLAKIMEVKGSDKFIAGANLSWLDFSFAELLDLLDKVSEGVFYSEFPAAKEYFDTVVALPGLAEYW